MTSLIINQLSNIASVLNANDIKIYDFDVSVSYDTDLANSYFDDFKNGHCNDNVNMFFGNRKYDYLVIFENEKVANESYYKKSKLARMTKSDLTNLADEMLGYGFDDSNKQALIDGLISITNKDYYTKHYDNESYNSLDYDFTVSGYSQGDYCKVKLVGNVEKWINKDYLTNIFYDTPINGMITISCNGEIVDEFSLYDLSDFNDYDSYDKDKLIDMISDYCKDESYHDLLIAYCNDTLKNTLNYY